MLAVYSFSFYEIHKISFAKKRFSLSWLEVKYFENVC